MSKMGTWTQYPLMIWTLWVMKTDSWSKLVRVSDCHLEKQVTLHKTHSLPHTLDWTSTLIEMSCWIRQTRDRPLDQDQPVTNRTRDHTETSCKSKKLKPWKLSRSRCRPPPLNKLKLINFKKLQWQSTMLQLVKRWKKKVMDTGAPSMSWTRTFPQRKKLLDGYLTSTKASNNCWPKEPFWKITRILTISELDHK